MKEMVCIVCPNSCKLSIDDSGSELKVSGAKCKRGEAFAKTELTAPTRTVTTTVKTAFGELPMLPVKTAGEIPKSKMFALMEAVRSIVVKDRLSMGDVVATDIAGTGVDLVATCSIPAAKLS